MLFTEEQAQLLAGSGRDQDVECADLVRALLDAGVRDRGDVQTIVALTPTEDPATVRLAQPVPNGERSASGRTAAFTQGQRYVALAALERAAAEGRSTSALHAREDVADAPPEDLAVEAALTPNVPEHAARLEKRDDPRRHDVGRLVQALRDDALYAASLHSKELFHSNMLAWYVEHDPALGDLLVNAWGRATPAPPYRAGREEQGLDLVVRDATGQAVLVIENKVVSLPADGQLRDYDGRIKNLSGEPARVLLSLARPAWTGQQETLDEGTWVHHDYDELRTLLATVARRADVADPDMLRRWRQMLDRLVELLALVGDPAGEEPVRLPPALRQELATARLDGPVQRLRGQAIASTVRRRLGDQFGQVQLGATVTNGSGLVDGFLPWGQAVRAGWQLQDGDWRLAVV